MARNSEKAMTALARWRRAKQEEEGTGPKDRQKRPYLATECDNVSQCEIFRQQIIRDISKSVTAIQNAGLGEFRIRDLNDHINKLLREKKHWENRLRELGGKSYSSKGAKMLDREGREVPGNKGYKYFGAARDLPGVRELFEGDKPAVIRKTRAELMKEVDAQYYGFRDDDDGLLVPLELVAEKEAVGRLVTEWKGAKEGAMEDEEELYMREVQDEEAELREAMQAGKESTVFARVKVPTQVGAAVRIQMHSALQLQHRPPGGYRGGAAEEEEAGAAGALRYRWDHHRPPCTPSPSHRHHHTVTPCTPSHCCTITQ
jgi:pre-mRNA-splicing factor ISY1